MKEWSQELWYEVDNGVYLEKKTTEDLINVVVTGDGGVVILETSARGSSLLACTYQSKGDAYYARHKGVTKKESSGQRTMAEALALASSDP